MTEPADTTDPWPRLSAALDQTQRQIYGFGTDDLDRSTPCGDYDGGTLLAHLVAVLRKLTAVRRGEATSTIVDPVTDITGGWGAAFRRARTSFERAWSADGALDGSYALSWATMSGREVLDTYTHEFTVHSWDLARVTGRVHDLDPDLAGAALEWFTDNLPAGSRGGGTFGPVVEVAPDAEIYTRLAGYVGRPVPEQEKAR